MRNLFFSLLLLPAFVSCGSGADNPRLAAALDSATTAGRRDAAVFADDRSTDMQREGALLLIRHKEAHMRAMGYDEAADAYINGAEEIIPDSYRQ